MSLADLLCFKLARGGVWGHVSIQETSIIKVALGSPFSLCCIERRPGTSLVDTVVKNPPANAGDTGSSPGPGRFHMPWSN